MKKLAFSLFGCLCFLFLLSCSKAPNNKVILRLDGGWYIPPAFHGNPYAPGGDGTHMHFIWNRLFLLVPATDQNIPRLGLSHNISSDRRVLTIKLRKAKSPTRD